MKRKKEKVPEFDEIIFENRNKKYGAYDLRKRYKSATSLSILGGSVFFTILMMAISLTTEEGTAKTGLKEVIIEVSDPVLPKDIPEPDIKPPPELKNTIKNLQPEVVNDTSQADSFIPITEEIIETTKDGNVTEEVIFTENRDPEIPAETKPFIVVEEPPEYPGGNTALLKYISENIKYPAIAQENNIQGRVILKFVVNPDGSADRIEVLRGIDPLLDNEAIRVVQSLPRFKPGKQGGVPVPVWFTLPVVFRLEIN
jgi:protein TonB